MKAEHKKLWQNSILALIFGFIIVGISAVIPHEEEYVLLKEIVRDIGIALLVAGIISIIYEWSTRNIEKTLTMKSIVEKSLETLIPGELWNEITDDVLARKIFRSDIDMEVSIIENELDLGNGMKVAIPPSQIVLKTILKYKLKNLFSASREIPIIHHLDQHMRDELINLPRFISVSINQKGKIKQYPEQELSNYVQNGRLDLTGQEQISSSNKDKIAEITVERYELVSFPGLYTMVMPDMVIPSKSGAPTVTVTLKDKIPGDINFKIETWFNSIGHEFENNDLTWHFSKVLLPGQGFSLIFSKK